MNAKECRFCKNCDVNRTNDIGQARCTRFSTYINLFDNCDYFISKQSEEFLVKELKEND